jgi:hypothetical protein
MSDNSWFYVFLIFVVCATVVIAVNKEKKPKEDLKESKYSVFSKVLEQKGFVQKPMDKFGRVPFVREKKLIGELTYTVSFFPSGRKNIEVSSLETGSYETTENSFMLDVKTEAELRMLLKMLGI